MKVVIIVLLALAALVSADSYGKQHVTRSHAPYYKVDWQVKDDEYYIDYGQVEIREQDNTKTNWWVALPGYSHIKRGDAINAQAHHSYSQGLESKPVYKAEYKPIQYKEEYKPVYKTEYKPTQYKEEYKTTEYKRDY